MADFGQVQLPNPQAGLQNYLQYPIIQAQGAAAQQDITDRATLRGLAPGLASSDPEAQRQAAGTAATLPQAGGTHAVQAINAMNADQRAALSNTLSVTGSLSGAILALPDSQQAQAWQQFRPYMVQAGAVHAPEQYPGKEFLNTHRVGALNVQQQIEQLGAAQVPVGSSDTTLNIPRPPGMSVLGGSPQAGGAVVAPASGSMIDRARAIHDGLVQRGMDSATALPMAANLLGESGGNPATVPGDGGASHGLGQWNGPRLAAFKAQNNGMMPAQAGLGRQLDFIKWEWDNTHKGAATATNAQATPEGKLGEIVRRYEIPANPDSDVAKRTGYLRQLQAAGIGAAPVQAAATPAAPGAPAPLQVAGPGAPTGGSAPRVMADLRAGQAAPPAGPAPMSSYVAPGGQPQSTLAPLAAPSPAITFTRSLNKPGLQPAPGAPGYAMGVDARGNPAMGPVPGLPPEISFEKTTDAVLPLDKRTGTQVAPAIPITNSARVTQTPGPGGTGLYQGAQKVGEVPYSGRPEQDKAYQGDRKTVETLTQAARSAQASMPRINEVAELAPQIASGAGGEKLHQAARILEAMGASPATIQAFTKMPSGSAADEFVKLTVQLAGESAKATTAANTGIDAIRLYQSANPGMSMGKDANIHLTNQMRVSAQLIQDYAQGALQHFNPRAAEFLKGGPYHEPLSNFDQQYLARPNPQIAAAAMGILNGDPFDKWSKLAGDPRLAAQAVGLASRIDPNVMVPGRGGGMVPAASVLGHPSLAPAPR